jgi:hypothetical protein
MPRSYPYGKVPIAIATVVSERFERPMVDCGYCSGQMLARSARGGVSNEGRVEGHKIRAKGGRAHWAGNTATELRRGLELALDVPTLGIARSSVLARVRAGYAVAVSLTYAKLPAYLKVQLNDFGHCVMLKAFRLEDGEVFVGYFDPLYEQGTQGTWAKWSDLEPALWSGGHTTTTVKYVPPRRYTVHFAEGAKVRTYNLRAPASGGGPWCIARNAKGGYAKDETTWDRAPSKASCTAPIPRQTCDGQSSATTALVTGGAFKDEHVKIDPRFGVTISSE